MGAISGIDCRRLSAARHPQTSEVWTGATFAGQPHDAEGLKGRRLATAKGVNNVVMARSRLFLPHARGVRHSRPVPRQHVHASRIIWAMEYALDKK